MNPQGPFKPCFIQNTDFYKDCHHLGYNPGLTYVNSYGESRIGALYNRVSFFGMQPVLIDHFVGQVIQSMEQIDKAEKKSIAQAGANYFNRSMWEKILKKYGGKLPLRIKAVKEGTSVPIGNVLYTIECLDKDMCHLVGHSETLLSHVWYPTTVCTNSFETKKDIYASLIKSGTPEMIEYMHHDFGARAVTHEGQSIRGGMAHMVHYRGSDTKVADEAIDYYYGNDEDARLRSVFATEHMVALSFGPGEGEYEYVKHVLSKVPKNMIASIVIDTYDYMNFVDNVITRPDIKEMIENRTGKVVLRPDSGNPIEVINRILPSLANSFGYSFNSKHYKVLNPRVGVIYGDKMKKNSIKEIYESIMANKWSADNMVVGSGTGTLQDFNRDTQSFAIKPSYGIINGKEVNFEKNPISQASKKSKKGMLKLHRTGNDFMTISSCDCAPEVFKGYTDELETVFEMGELVRKQTFPEIVKIANESFMQVINK